MEPLKGGLLADENSTVSKVLKKADPSASLASWAMRLWLPDGVFNVLSGMNSMEQMEDNINTFQNLKPLSDDEMKVIDEAVNVLKSIPRVPAQAATIA